MAEMQYYHMGLDGKNYPDPVEPEYAEWGRQRLQYLKTKVPELYMEMIQKGEMNKYLNDMEERAMEMFESMTAQRAQFYGVDEKLKAENPARWIGLMGNITHKVTKVIEETFIY